MYRNIPLHQLRHRPDAVGEWSPGQAQEWDCYGERFSTLIYPYLDGIDCRAQVAKDPAWFSGRYRLTAVPLADAFTHQPEQSKEFIFIALDNGRFTAQPSNRVAVLRQEFHDRRVAKGRTASANRDLVRWVMASFDFNAPRLPRGCSVSHYMGPELIHCFVR